jgi:hypothetical protein
MTTITNAPFEMAWKAGVVDEEITPEVEAEIRATCLDYFDGWFDGDAVRMDRALHPALAKICIGQDKDRAEIADVDTKETMVEATRQGRGRARDLPDRKIRVDVTARSGNIASAVIHSAVYIDYVLLYRTTDGWKITEALWQWAPGNGPRA